MAERGERRSPTSHRTPTQMRRQASGYNHRPEQIKKRVQRDKARRQLMKEGVVRKGDGKDVNHKKPIRAGGSNARSNLNVQSRATNRAWAKKPTGKGPTMAGKKARSTKTKRGTFNSGLNPRLVETKKADKKKKPAYRSPMPKPKPRKSARSR